LRILFLHRDAALVERCLDELDGVDVPVRADVARTSEQFSERLRSKTYDLVLAEYPNAVGAGTQALQRLRRIQAEKHIPLIFLAGKLRRETAAELISQGAADCIDADALSHLPVAIRRALDENKLRGERDHAEQQLRHSEAHYRALVGNLTYGICRCAPDGQFLDANDAMVSMLGYPSREALLAKNLAGEVLADPSTRKLLLGHLRAGEPPEPFETEWKRHDGTLLKIRLSGRDVGGDDGHTQAYELIVEDITKQRELEDRLRQQAAKDPLTGLANYRHLAHVLDNEIKRSARTGREFSLLLFDVDGLKQINDRHGRVVGSQALCRVADVLCIFSRVIDTAARLGGDEFALVLPETGRSGAHDVARRIQHRLAHDGREPVVALSVGLAVYPRDGDRLDTLLAAADVAMYAMKDRHHRVDAPVPAPQEEDAVS
jgi:diguanylate cyclase (GGDEF)-like protein/PAS domain S-box-containing protein